MDDMIDNLRSRLGPCGDLYLTKTHVEHLIRWIELANKQMQFQDDAIKHLKLELAAARLDLRLVQESVNKP